MYIHFTLNLNESDSNTVWFITFKMNITALLTNLAVPFAAVSHSKTQKYN